jgi:hypothetical protein
MEDKNLLLEYYDLDISSYFNDLSVSMADMTRTTLENMATEMKKLKIFEDSIVHKV